MQRQTKKFLVSRDAEGTICIQGRPPTPRLFTKEIPPDRYPGYGSRSCNPQRRPIPKENLRHVIPAWLLKRCLEKAVNEALKSQISERALKEYIDKLVFHNLHQLGCDRKTQKIVRYAFLEQYNSANRSLEHSAASDLLESIAFALWFILGIPSNIWPGNALENGYLASMGEAIRTKRPKPKWTPNDKLGLFTRKPWSEAVHDDVLRFICGLEANQNAAMQATSRKWLIMCKEGNASTAMPLLHEQLEHGFTTKRFSAQAREMAVVLKSLLDAGNYAEAHEFAKEIIDNCYFDPPHGPVDIKRFANVYTQLRDYIFSDTPCSWLSAHKILHNLLSLHAALK
ncbi:MAG: hypothetical protein AAF355_06855 [Myxococcota bacterium]